MNLKPRPTSHTPTGSLIEWTWRVFFFGGRGVDVCVFKGVFQPGGGGRFEWTIGSPQNLPPSLVTEFWGHQQLFGLWFDPKMPPPLSGGVGVTSPLVEQFALRITRSYGLGYKRAFFAFNYIPLLHISRLKRKGGIWYKRKGKYNT